MDNLLQKTITFLFVPEASLSVVFLVVFVLMFAWGYKIYHKCKDTLDGLQDVPEKYKRIQNKMSPELYLKRRFTTLSDEEGQLEGLPNSFVSVGILATFIGLGVAIQGAASLLNETTIDLTKMTDVLRVIAFKFQTSIWGIVFSLIFQSLIVDRYFRQKQDKWDEFIDKLYEIEGDSSRLLLERQNEILDKAFSEQLMRDQARENHITEEIYKLQELIKNVTNIENTKLQDILELFRDHDNKLKLLYENMGEYTAASVKFVNTATVFDDDVKKFNKNVTGRLNQINQTMCDIDTNNQEFLNQFDMKATEALENILHEKEAYQKIFIRTSKEYIGDVREAVNELLENNRQQIHDTYHTAVENLNKVVSEVNGSIEQINQSTQKIDSSVQKMQKAITAIHNSSEVATNNMNQAIKTAGDDLSEFVVQYTNALQTMNEKFVEITEKILGNESSHVGLIEESMKNNTKLLSGTGEKLREELGEQRQIYNEALTEINKNIDNLSAVLTQNINNLSAVLKEYRDSSVNIINTGLQNQNKSLLEGFTKISQDYTTAVKEQSEYIVNTINTQLPEPLQMALQRNSWLEQLVNNSNDDKDIEGRDE